MKLKTSKKVCIQICWCYSFVNFILYASVENADKMNGLAGLHNGPDVFNKTLGKFILISSLSMN